MMKKNHKKRINEKISTGLFYLENNFHEKNRPVQNTQKNTRSAVDDVMYPSESTHKGLTPVVSIDCEMVLCDGAKRLAR